MCVCARAHPKLYVSPIGIVKKIVTGLKKIKATLHK